MHMTFQAQWQVNSVYIQFYHYKKCIVLSGLFTKFTSCNDLGMCLQSEKNKQILILEYVSSKFTCLECKMLLPCILNLK